MSGSSRNAAPIVPRTYRDEPDYCAHALELLLKTSLNSQATKGGPYDLTNHPTKECMTSQDKKGMQNADVHGD
jgi:hypothetical protein